MRNLFLKFRKDESGASLVEYAVALVVVTIIGGAGVILLGQNAGDLAEAGCDTVGAAGSLAISAAGSTYTNASVTSANC